MVKLREAMLEFLRDTAPGLQEAEYTAFVDRWPVDVARWREAKAIADVRGVTRMDNTPPRQGPSHEELQRRREWPRGPDGQVL